MIDEIISPSIWADQSNGRSLRDVMTEPLQFTNDRLWTLDRYRKHVPPSRGMTLDDIRKLPDSFFVEIDGDRRQANIYQHAPNGQIQYVYSYPLI